MHKAKLLPFVAAIGLATYSIGAALEPATTDPAQAGPDFAIQGEFAGEVPNDEGGFHKVGVQVIALGNGKFRSVAHIGGLPGAGWDGGEKHETDGEMVDGVARFKRPDVVGEIKDGVMTARNSGGQVFAEFKKVERTSPTLGVAPRTGAVVLFDGSTADNFEGGRMTDDGLLMVGVKSKAKFRDFYLHMEFRLPFMPESTGQGRANSGLYLQDRYECQILDSFGLKGLNNECGGFYQAKDPSVNMCLPPLAWQTYDIDFTAAKFDDQGKKVKNAVVTVKHNGVAIHENFELPDSTPGGQPETAEPGPIQLQDHGNPVHFRNIWVVEN